jgi:hypothetical protein
MKAHIDMGFSTIKRWLVFPIVVGFLGAGSGCGESVSPEAADETAKAEAKAAFDKVKEVHSKKRLQ